MTMTRKMPAELVSKDNEPFGVYVHWPFCLAKCPYCDFNSHVRHGGVAEDRFLAAYLTELDHFAGLAPGPHRFERILRWRHAVADAAANRGCDPRPDRETLGRRGGCRDHARSQSDQRRGGALRGLPRGRRQPGVARRAGARRSKPQSARADAHGRGSPCRARARQAAFRARVVRLDLCARRANRRAMARRS